MERHRRSEETNRHTELQPPAVSQWLQRGFRRFVRSMLKKNFHAIAVERDSLRNLEIPPDASLIVYVNHPSWWDPLIAHFLCENRFPERQFYAPIDATALQQYKVFAKLGFFGVDAKTTSGRAAFLQTSSQILHSSGTSLWMTPEGRFTDVRDQSNNYSPGLAHLCTHQSSGYVLPLAMELPFWEERLPECLLQFGTPLDLSESLSKAEWQDVLQDRMRTLQQSLAARAIARDASSFQPLLQGGKGAGKVYDGFRRLRSWIQGTPLPIQHGDKFQ